MLRWMGTSVRAITSMSLESESPLRASVKGLTMFGLARQANTSTQAHQTLGKHAANRTPLAMAVFMDKEQISDTTKASVSVSTNLEITGKGSMRAPIPLETSGSAMVVPAVVVNCLIPKIFYSTRSQEQEFVYLRPLFPPLSPLAARVA